MHTMRYVIRNLIKAYKKIESLVFLESKVTNRFDYDLESFFITYL